jgi:hypothetical protein
MSGKPELAGQTVVVIGGRSGIRWLPSKPSEAARIVHRYWRNING